MAVFLLLWCGMKASLLGFITCVKVKNSEITCKRNDVY